MSLWGRIVRTVRTPFAARRTDGAPLTTIPDWLNPRTLEAWDGRPCVTEETAHNLSAVWAANRVLSGAVSILPLKVYERDKKNGRNEVHDTPAARLAWKPNREMTSITFWETMTTLMVMRGNAYGEIETNSYGEPVAIWPLQPGACRPERDDNGEIVYLCHGSDGRELRMPPRKIFHVPGMGCDGIKGYAVLECARRSLEVFAGYEQAAKSLIENGMRPSGALKFPGSLQDLQKKDKAKETAEKHAGVTNWSKMLLLYGGMEWQPFGISPDDAQFLETRMFQIEEVARWFMIPPHMLYDLRRSTNNNIEHQGQQFVTFSLMYWLTKIAQEYDRKIVRDDAGDTYSEHLVDALLRADIKSRYDAYGRAINWGWLSPNDARKKENESPVKGGDQYFIPANMRPIDEPFPQKPAAAAKPGEGVAK